MTAQAAGDSVSFGEVSGGKIIGAGGGAGSIIGETVEVNGPVIHIHNLTADGARILRGMMDVSPEVPSAGAPMRTQETSTLAHTGIDEMLRLMKSYASRGLKALQVEAGAVQFSAVDLLLRKAVLLVTEANQLTVEASTPEKAELTRRMDQSALGEMLAGFDSGAAQARLREALEVLREAHELAPDNTAVMLQTAQVLGRLDGDVAEERELLDEVMRRVGTPWTEEQRLHRAQALYLLGSLGRNRDEALLREAREGFARLGRVDWMRQCDQAIKVVPSLPGRHRKKVRINDGNVLTVLARRITYATLGVVGVLGGGYVLLVLLALWLQPQPGPDPIPGPEPESFVRAFSPAGSWVVRFADQAGDVFNLNLSPSGLANGSFFVEGRPVSLDGSWTYDASAQVLSMNFMEDGIVIGGTQIQVLEVLGDGFIGTGDDGNRLRFIQR